MADNQSAVKHPQGNYYNWIEIYNAGNEAIDLGGMYLTDDLSNLNKWQIPDSSPDSTTIMPGGYLVFWTAKKRGNEHRHCGLELTSPKTQIGLTASDGVTVIDSCTHNRQITDIAYGRYPNGEDQWEFIYDYTPGSPNISSNSLALISKVGRKPENPTPSDNVNIVALITDDGYINTVYIHYNYGSGYQRLTMYDDGKHGDQAANDDYYGAFIPVHKHGVEINYYLEAVDNNSASSYFPPNAPTATSSYIVNDLKKSLQNNKFAVDSDTTTTNQNRDIEID